jgi:hypothetical protein
MLAFLFSILFLALAQTMNASLPEMVWLREFNEPGEQNPQAFIPVADGGFLILLASSKADSASPWDINKFTLVA